MNSSQEIKGQKGDDPLKIVCAWERGRHIGFG